MVIQEFEKKILTEIFDLREFQLIEKLMQIEKDYEWTARRHWIYDRIESEITKSF